MYFSQSDPLFFNVVVLRDSYLEKQSNFQLSCLKYIFFVEHKNHTKIFQRRITGHIVKRKSIKVICRPEK